MRWLPPGAERIVSGISRVMYAVWLGVAFIVWGRLGSRMYAADGALDTVAVLAFVVAVVAAVALTSWVVRRIVGLFYGFRYSELDMTRYEQHAAADVRRQAAIDRATGR